MIDKIITFAIRTFTAALSVALGIGYIMVGMTDRLERGCWVLYICVVACIWFSILRRGR